MSDDEDPFDPFEDAPEDGDPFESLSPREEDPLEGVPEQEGDPFEDIHEREGDPFETADDVFREMGVEEVDPDTVWERLGDFAAETRPGGAAGERTRAEVSKHAYCEQCQFFSEPPDVFCSHEGTEILAFLDMETVRVVDCPVVAERRALEQQE